MLALLEALQDRPSATGPELAARLGVDVRTLRRDVVALRDLGIPVEGERGRGGSYRLRPGYRVPPLMFTSRRGRRVALGLMAARRLGLETDGALAKVRRVLPDRVRLRRRVARAARSASPAAIDAAPPDGETLLALADAARRGRRVSARYTRLAGRRRPTRELSPYGVVAHHGRWYVAALRPQPRRRRARCAPTASRDVRPGGPGAPAPDGLRRRPPSSAARSPACPGSTSVEVAPAHRPRAGRSRASRPRWPSWSRPTAGTRPADARRLARLGRRPARRRRLRLHDPAPAELRDSVEQLAQRLNAA